MGSTPAPLAGRRTWRREDLYERQDTNVLAYAYDRSEPVKQQRDLDVLDRLAIGGTGVIST